MTTFADALAAEREQRTAGEDALAVKALTVACARRSDPDEWPTTDDLEAAFSVGDIDLPEFEAGLEALLWWQENRG